MSESEPKLIIGILNKNNKTDGPIRRSVIDKTWGGWADSCNIPYTYIHGGPAKNKGKKIRNKRIEFYVSDGYHFLPSKVRLFCKFLVEQDAIEWDYMYKCDDDTFVHVPRLIDFIKNQVSVNGWDYVGCKVDDKGTASGGAGYILSRKAVEIIAKTDIKTGAEDVLVAEHLKNHGIKLHHSSLFDPWGKLHPTKDNEQITTHYIKTDDMSVLYRPFYIDEIRQGNIESPLDIITIQKPATTPVDEPEPILPIIDDFPSEPKEQPDNIPTGDLNDWIGGRMEYLRYEYPINRQSTVLIVGSNMHQYIQSFLEKFPNTPNIHYFDPIPEFVGYLKKNKYRVKVHDTGVDDFEGKKTIYLQQDGTGFYTNKGPVRRVDCIKMSSFMSRNRIQSVDLLVLNCEGSEYGILDDLIKTGWIGRIKNIQVQFHNLTTTSWNCVKRREEIIQGLRSRGFVQTYSYPWVWEGFTI